MESKCGPEVQAGKDFEQDVLVLPKRHSDIAWRRKYTRQAIPELARRKGVLGLSLSILPGKSLKSMVPQQPEVVNIWPDRFPALYNY